MKGATSAFLFLFMTKLSFGQTQSIAGAWYWSDSTKQTSMFFNKDGSLSMHTGPKGGVILTKDLKSGTYILTTGLLTIKWADNSVEKDKIKFIDTDSFVLTIADKTQKTNQTFRRVVDKEVIEDK